MVAVVVGVGVKTKENRQCDLFVFFFGIFFLAAIDGRHYF